MGVEVAFGTIPWLQNMIMNIQYSWHIFMMARAAEAGDYPAPIVYSLIKWQIVTQDIYICPWGGQTFILWFAIVS